MQLVAPFPLTPTLSPGEREHLRPIWIGGTIWCVRPGRVEEGKAASPLRSAAALHRAEPSRYGKEGPEPRSAALPRVAQDSQRCLSIKLQIDSTTVRSSRDRKGQNRIRCRGSI